MPRESAVLQAARRLRSGRGPRPPLEEVPRPPLRVVDVALLHGERSDAIRAYIDAKAAWAQATGLIEHHVIVPGPHRAPRERPAAPCVRRGVRGTRCGPAPHA
jgi:hypothetical protein